MNPNSNAGKNNFGKKGWLMIAMAGLMYFFFAGTVNDGLNVIVGYFSGLHDLDYNAVLSSATPAAWFGILGIAVWTVIVKKIGSRLGGTLALALGGLSYFAYGLVHSVTGFLAVTALVNFMAYGFCNTAAQVMLAHWFPTRKGLALGWATMGTNLSSAVFVLILTFLVGIININGAFYAVGILMIVVSAIYYACVRDFPEDFDCLPDNGQPLAIGTEADGNNKSNCTLGKLLKNKDVWLLSIGYGIYIMITVALISQIVPRLTSNGWDQSKATSMMTIAAILGLFGSYATGWLDEKIGTKKASILYGVWYLIAVILCAVPQNNTTMYLSVFFIGIGIGGIGNLYPSMVGTLFNRKDFVLGLGIANFISLIIRSFTFSIMAYGLAKFGGYTGAYAIFAVINVIGIICVALIKDKRIEA